MLNNENKQLSTSDSKFIESLETLRKDGIKEIRAIYQDNLEKKLRLFYNVGTTAPDEDLTSPDGLMRIANLISPEFEMTDVFNSSPNSGSRIKFILEKELRDFWETQDLGILSISYSVNPSFSEDDEFKSIDEQYERIRSISSDYSDILFQHIEPIDSLVKKVEAVRVFKSVKEIKELMLFLYDKKSFFYEYRNGLGKTATVRKLKSKFENEYPINSCSLFKVNFNFRGRIEAIANTDGRLVFYDKNSPIYCLNITRIQRCVVCQKFIWIERGKTNVVKTCSEEHAKKYKNDINSRSYKGSPETFMVNRAYRERENDKSLESSKNLDCYTEAGFNEFLKSAFEKNVHKAWADTYFLYNGVESREKREVIKEITSELPTNKIILDLNIFENRLPALLKRYNIILFNEHFMYFQRSFTYQRPLLEALNIQTNKLNHLKELWQSVSTHLLDGENKTDPYFPSNLINDLAEFLLDYCFSMKFPKRINIRDFKKFIRCKTVLVALINDAYIIADNVDDYEELFELCKQRVIDADSFFSEGTDKHRTIKRD